MYLDTANNSQGGGTDTFKSVRMLRRPVEVAFDMADKDVADRYSFFTQQTKVWKALGLDNAQLQQLPLQNTPRKTGLTALLLNIAENDSDFDSHTRRGAIHLWGEVIAHNGLQADLKEIERLRRIGAKDNVWRVRETAAMTANEFQRPGRYICNHAAVHLLP